MLEGTAGMTTRSMDALLRATFLAVDFFTAVFLTAFVALFFATAFLAGAFLAVFLAVFFAEIGRAHV